MKLQKFLLLPVMCLLAFTFSACGDDDSGSSASSSSESSASETTEEAPAEEAPAEGSDGIRVAIVAPSAENDLAFSQSIVDGVNELTGVSEIAITPGTFIVEEAATAIRDYADAGYDLVIAHGSQYGGPLQEIAPDFPDTAFAWGTAVDTFGLDNVSAYTAASNEGGYVLGVIAAEVGGNIGIVGPIAVGDAKLYVDGFTLGAESGGAEVSVTYIESFSDVALASETASAFVSNGADVLTGTAQMTVGAIGVAEQEGLLWFGTQSNQTSAAADGVVAASQVYHWEIALQSLVDDIGSGKLGGNTYEINLENEGLVIEWGNWDVPSALTDLLDQVSESVINGEVTTIIP